MPAQTPVTGPWLIPSVAALAFLAGASPAAAASCEDLAFLKLSNSAVTLTQAVPAGAFVPPAGAGRGGGFGDLPAFCRVTATLAPSPDSNIAIEVWLPAAGWNGKFLGVGNGGWGGSINRDALADAVRRGYATASTDTGHEGGGGPWMESPEKLNDFGYRAVHEMTVKAKAIVAAYYDTGARLSYFNGCSGGGRQGLMAAQRFPRDFDGIVAGAPALNTTGRAAFSMSIAQTLHTDEARYIPPAKYPAIHDAVLQACDRLDGVADRVIENPAVCRFDPKVLECKAGDAATCLTPPQVEAARKMYEPLTNSRTGVEIFPGLSYGSELGWSTFGGPQPFGLGAQMFQYMVFKDPAWDYRTLNFDSHMALVDRLEHGAINAMNPDLSAFVGAGGKLIQYHGWSDPQISAASSAQYYQRVVETAGGVDKVAPHYRLFMVPGMNHCGGGAGTASFDMLSALEQWVEQGRAPDHVPAAHVTNGKADRTRPLCPYPQTAAYKGSGSTDDAANFVCR